MSNETHRLLIQEDYQDDTLKIFWREKQGSREVWYSFDGDYLVQTTVESTDNRPFSIKPFLVFPMGLGKEFLKLLDIEINKLGINQQKEDMKSGKIEILEQELSFSKEQLVKFIDKFTK